MLVLALSVSVASASERRILLATVPSSGSTWLRQVVEIARGVASETVYAGWRKDVPHRRYNPETYSWGHPCGTMTNALNPTGDPTLPRAPMHARFGICPLMRLANESERVLIKTHFPWASFVGEGEAELGNRPGQFGGVIMTRRDSADNLDACARLPKDVSSGQGGRDGWCDKWGAKYGACDGPARGTVE